VDGIVVTAVGIRFWISSTYPLFDVSTVPASKGGGVGQESEVRSQRSEVRGQGSGIGSQESGGRSQSKRQSAGCREDTMVASWLH